MAQRGPGLPFHPTVQSAAARLGPEGPCMAATGHADDFYLQARIQANRDAADECAQKAAQFAKDDPARAQRLLSKAAGLWPEKYTSRLEGDSGHGQSHPAETNPSRADSHCGAASSRAERAAGTSSSNGGAHDSDAWKGSGTGPRASQPYSFVPPSAYAREQPGLRTPPENDAAGAGAGAGCTGQTHSHGGGAAQDHPNLRRRPHPDARPQQQEQHQHQHQQASAGQHTGHEEGPGITATSGSWLDQRIDLVMKRLVELGSSRKASAQYWFTYCLLLLMVTVTLASRTTPWLLGLASKTAGQRLWAAMQRSFLVVLLCALPALATAAILAYLLLPWLLWGIRMSYWPFIRLPIFIIVGIFWNPNLVVEGALAAALYWSPWKRLKRLFPAPIIMFLAGPGWMTPASLLTYIAMVAMSSATLQSAVAVAVGIICLKTLLWYKAMPALLLVSVAWVVSIAVKDDSDKGRSSGSSSQQGSQGTRNGSSSYSSGHQSGQGQGSGYSAGGAGGADGSWWQQRFGKTKQKQAIPKGASGEVLRVLQSKDLFDVLELPRSCDDEDVRRAKRTKSLATHPDKLGGAPGAKEAFQRVTEAAEALSDAGKRHVYRQRLYMEQQAAQRPPPSQAQAQPQAPSSRPSGGASTSAAAGAGDIVMPCRACGRSHVVFALPTRPVCARFCNSCQAFHPARDGDAWVDKQGGFWGQKRVHACLQGVIFDMTSYAMCNEMLFDSWGREVAPNSCQVPFRFTTVSETSSGTPSQSKKTGKKGRRR